MMNSMHFVLACVTIFYAASRLWTLLEDFLLGGVEFAIQNAGLRFATDAVAAVFAAYMSIMPYASRLGVTLVVTPLSIAYFWIIVYSAPRLWRLGHSLMDWGRKLNDA